MTFREQKKHARGYWNLEFKDVIQNFPFCIIITIEISQHNIVRIVFTKRNRTGPKTVPCGTPDVVITKSLLYSLLTLCFITLIQI